MGLGAKLAAEIYASSESPKRASSAFAQNIARSGIVRTADFKRIELLERRVWDQEPDLEFLRKEMSEAFRATGGTMELWPVQAAALRDLYEWKGLFAPIGVGFGKALISLVAPELLDAERPILLVPASLRDQTKRKVIPQMKKHWKLSDKLRIIGYEELGLAKNAELLNQIEPDLIIADECHKLTNTKAGRTRRVARWMKEHPDTMFVALSGTITRRSLRDYWHIALWCLKIDQTPLPLYWRELQDWADALDEGVPPERRAAPGALLRLCSLELKTDPITLTMRSESAREGFQRRLTETPGVVATSDTELGTSLIVSERKVQPSLLMRAHLERLWKKWELPNGDLVTEAVDLWRHGRELACGFFYRWDPAPPIEWMDARREWKKYVRETLSHNRRNLDTELQVWNECERNEKAGALRWDGVSIFLAWRDIKDTFQPNSVPVWEDDFLVQDVAEWLREKQPGIAWIEFPSFGERVAAASGFPFFGAGEKASREIADVQGPIIASVRAHGEGKNLQDRYARNLVVTCPPSGKTWEQLFGRTHRNGQLADEVIFEIYQHTDDLKKGFSQARADAAYIEQTTGSRQKLSYAEITIP
jgi:hypothetical protein